MNALSWLVNDSLSVRLTISLLHFLWQGCLIAIVVVAGGLLLRGFSPRLRYSFNVTAMLIMAACLPITFMMLDAESFDSALGSKYGTFNNERPELASVHALDIPSDSVASAFGRETPRLALDAPATEESSETPKASWFMSTYTKLSRNFPTLSRWIAALYVCGVIAVLVRLFQGLMGGRRLRKLATPISEPALLKSVRKLAHQIGLKSVPTVAWCRQISIPVVVGVMKPMILLPMEIVTGLTSNQLEALLLHELSHIRRFDPIINLMQRFVEAILFFHPAVWCVSRRVSFERENVADDMVLAAGWDRPQYADALVRVAELATFVTIPKKAIDATVLGASGQYPSEFKLRVLRLLDHPPKPDISRTVIVLAILFVAASSIVVYSSVNFNETPSERNEPAPAEQAEAPKPALRISGRVLDAETGEPIENCRMVPSMSEREETAHVTWQSQYLKNFSEGRYVYETDRPWEKTRLRIEAEGYLPALTRSVDKGEVVELDVKLERKVLTGMVRLPNGKPAAGAQVALASWTNEIKVDDGELSYQGHGSKFRRVLETDEHGIFAIPAEIDPSVLIVAHPEGYAEHPNAQTSLARRLPLNPLHANDKSQDDTEVIMLEPWGRVEGRAMLDTKPVVGAKYWISQGRSDDVHVWSHTNVETVGDGRFEVEHVPPGRFGSCQRYVDGSDGTTSYSLSGLATRFDVPAGKTVSLLFASRTIIGKLVANDGLQRDIDWSKATLQVALQRPRFRGLMGGIDESVSLWSQFLQTEEGKQYTLKNFSIDANGSFRIEGVLPAEYDLRVNLKVQGIPQGDILSGSERIAVPAVVTTEADLPIDLGTISMKMSQVQDAGNQTK